MHEQISDLKLKPYIRTQDTLRRLKKRQEFLRYVPDLALIGLIVPVLNDHLYVVAFSFLFPFWLDDVRKLHKLQKRIDKRAENTFWYFMTVDIDREKAFLAFLGGAKKTLSEFNFNGVVNITAPELFLHTMNVIKAPITDQCVTVPNDITDRKDLLNLLAASSVSSLPQEIISHEQTSCFISLTKAWINRFPEASHHKILESLHQELLTNPREE